jgi:acetyl esterase/lipase
VHRLALLAVVLFVANPCRAQQAKPLDVHPDIVYASPGNIAQTLDIYVPTGLAAPPPLVIYIHGGAWQGGSKDHPMVLGLTREGFALASINYRLSQVAIWPAQIYDCKAAVRWLRAHASTYGYDGSRIGLVGDSAGGHLVALLGTTANNPKVEGNEGNVGVSSAVQAVVDYYGPSDFLGLADQVTPERKANLDNPVTHLFGTPLWNNGPVVAEEQVAKDASPVTYVSASSAPFFIIQGDHDNVVPPQQSIELNAALQKAGADSTLTIVKGGGHGFHDPPSAMAAVAFLKKHLGVQ